MDQALKVTPDLLSSILYKRKRNNMLYKVFKKLSLFFSRAFTLIFLFNV